MQLKPIVFSLLMSKAAFAECPKRISSVYIDRCEIKKLCIYPGRKTTLDFPCKITRTTTGPSGDVLTSPTETLPNEIDIWLKEGTSKPTNLTVRCGKQIAVFDVIPSMGSHTDYLEILGFENQGSCYDQGKSLINASWMPQQQIIKKRKVKSRLIDSSNKRKRSGSIKNRMEKLIKSSSSGILEK